MEGEKRKKKKKKIKKKEKIFTKSQGKEKDREREREKKRDFICLGIVFLLESIYRKMTLEGGRRKQREEAVYIYIYIFYFIFYFPSQNTLNKIKFEPKKYGHFGFSLPRRRRDKK